MNGMKANDGEWRTSAQWWLTSTPQENLTHVIVSREFPRVLFLETFLSANHSRRLHDASHVIESLVTQTYANERDVLMKGVRLNYDKHAWMNIHHWGRGV